MPGARSKEGKELRDVQLRNHQLRGSSWERSTKYSTSVVKRVFQTSSKRPFDKGHQQSAGKVVLLPAVRQQV